MRKKWLGLTTDTYLPTYLPTYQRGDRKKELTKQNDKNFDNDSFRNVAIAVVMMMITMSK